MGRSLLSVSTLGLLAALSMGNAQAADTATPSTTASPTVVPAAPTATTASPEVPPPASEVMNYTLDPMHTYVLWHIDHFGFSNPSGKWLGQGVLALDKNKPENSTVKATINVANVSTGIPQLDEHLQGPLFFDTKKFPIATFVSTKVDVINRDTADVEGTLTLHGVSKPVTLHVKLNKMAVNPINNKDTVGFTATAEIKRSDFGMTTLLPGLGDAIPLEIEVEAYKSN